MSGSDPEQPPPTPPYGQNPAGQNPYGQEQYGAPPPYQQPYQPYEPYQQPAGGPAPQQPYGQYSFTPQAASHPSATTALVLSLIGLTGIVFCGGLTLVLSPFAWVIGGRAVREIDARPGAYSGREIANAGRIMGIIGTVLLIIGIVVTIAFIALMVAVANDPTYSSSDY